MKKDKTIRSALRAGLLILDVAGESEEDEKKKRKTQAMLESFFFTPPAGLEPATS
jgi:hypothetical protein